MTVSYDIEENIEMADGVCRLIKIIGWGGSASVYQGVSFIDGAEKVVAVKQSRASLRLKRPMLQHEARVLQLLQGHPTIAQVFAYGHLTHFEFLSLELLGSTLGDLKEKEGPLGVKRVAQIAVQMISALQHVHDHGIVHRDVKPYNILVSLDNPDQVRLIDFGIAIPLHSGTPNKQDPIKKRVIIGSLSWASLNSHDGYDLSRRDDLESLAYTLLDLVRDSLPWRRYDRGLVPLFRRWAHVKKKKIGWNGARFAIGSVMEFGGLLDHARSLEFNDRPDYDHWCQVFSGLHESYVQAEGVTLVKPQVPPTPKVCIVSPGQLVFVRVLAKVTIEGQVNEADDLSYWHDPALCTKDWVTTFRPAIVLGTTWTGTYHKIRVLPITQGEPHENAAKKHMRIINPRYAAGDEEIVLPDWPLERTYCYSFLPALESFVAISQTSDPIPAFWKVSDQDLRMLSENFSRKPPLSQSDALLYRQMVSRFIPSRIYADIKPMLPETLHLGFDCAEIDWKGKRGWFDELVKINQKASADAGRPWYGAGSSVENGDERHDKLDSSYCDFDVDEWDNGQRSERSNSLTLGPDIEGKMDNALGKITVVDKAFGTQRRVYRA